MANDRDEGPDAEEGLLAARITIEERVGEDGSVIWAQFVDGGGEQLPLVQILGLLRMSEDTAIRQAMGEAGD